jgi:hypothetical protein
MFVLKLAYFLKIIKFYGYVSMNIFNFIVFQL